MLVGENHSEGSSVFCVSGMILVILLLLVAIVVVAVWPTH